jgi:hypothetical protein
MSLVLVGVVESDPQRCTDGTATLTLAAMAQVFTVLVSSQHAQWVRSIAPYTRYIIDRWVQKAYEASKAGATVVCLLPVSTSSQWWTRYVAPYATIKYLEKRLKFGGSRVNAPFDSAMVIFRPQGETHTL